MAKRYSQEKIDQILGLLARGIAQNKVAKMTGVGKATVWRMLHEYGDGSKKRKPPREEPEHRYEGKCPQCGHRVLMPCLQCKMERYVEEQKRANPTDRP